MSNIDNILNSITNVRLRKEFYLHCYGNINNREIKGWYQERSKVSQVVDVSENSITFHINVKDNKYVIAKMIFPVNYPFSKPKVFFGDIDYRSILAINPVYLRNDICLCCSSILCNWYPGHGISSVIDEIIVNTNKVLNSQELKSEMIHCEKIIEKYFGFYIPVIEYL